MNRQSASSESQSTRASQTSAWIHRLLVLMTGALCWIGGEVQSDVATLPRAFDRAALEYPVAIQGDVVRSPDELDARVMAVGIGARVALVDAAGRLVDVPATVPLYSPWHVWITRINGLFFLAVSLVVFASRLSVVPGRDLFWACLLYGLAVMIGGIHPPASVHASTVAFPILRIVALVALPILMLHVGLTFPQRARLFTRSPGLFPSIVVAGVTIAAWESFVWTRWFASDAVGHWEAIQPARRAAGIFLATVFAGGCLGLVNGTETARSDREREQVKWVLLGIALGAMPYVFLHALPAALGFGPILPVAAARMFSIVIPVAFSFVVIRHRFLDVDIIIRRSLIYLVLASMLVGVYALLGIFAGERVVERWPQAEPYVPVVATLVSALLFNPTRRAIARAIDRLFFKIQFDYTQALAGFRRELASCQGQQQLAEAFARFLAQLLAPEASVVVLRHEERVFRAGNPLPVASVAPLGSRASTVIAVPGATARGPIESTSFPAVWRDAGYVLAHRVATEQDDHGYVVIGPKSNERRYLAEDLDLVANAGREVGLRLERINLEQEVLDEVVARHRTEEMSRFRTDFFAQFAHDLRSPLTSISWSARNLLDGVVGQVSPAQREYLDGIESSARQLVRLVNNLLEVTRLESGGPAIELAAVDLDEVVASSIAKLRVTAQAKDVSIAAELAALPPVQGHPEKLLEIVDNLLENAIRYAPPGSAVDVHAKSEDGEVALSIGDRGPGLDADDVETLFEAYRQGAPSPHSNQQGFGLGLFVVRSWTERMGGRVTGGNRDGGGAEFRVVLPVFTDGSTEDGS